MPGTGDALYLDRVEISRVDMRSPVPAYLQLADQLRKNIARSRADERVASIQEIVTQTGLAIGTVQKAIKLIKSEGPVYTVPGRGTFVRG